jgi:hypothetical protein
VVYEIRGARDYFWTALDEPVAIASPTITSDSFVSLPTTYSTTSYLPLILHEPATARHEVVWVVAHIAGSRSLTVVRGREGTSAQDWSAGTQVACGPTGARDGLGVYPSTGLPTDPHVGERVVLSDKSQAVEYTPYSGWQASVGSARPGDFGLTNAGGAIPDSAAIVARGGSFNGAAGTGGLITIVYKAPFPNSCTTIQVTPTTLTAYNVVFRTGSQNSVQFDLWVYRSTDGAALPGQAVNFYYLCMGY